MEFESKKIVQKRKDARGLVMFLAEVQKAALDGYYIDPKAIGMKGGPSVVPWFTCVVHKADESILDDTPNTPIIKDTPKAADLDTKESTEETPLKLDDQKVENAQDISKEKEATSEEKKEGVIEEEYSILEDPKAKKSSLLTYAKDNGIEIPEEAKSPAAIKKIIKNNLQ